MSTPDSPKINIYIFGLSSLLILISITAMVYVFTLSKSNLFSKSKNIPINVNQFISVEHAQEIIVHSDQNLIAAIKQKINDVVGSENSITAITMYNQNSSTSYTSKGERVTSQQFITSISKTAPNRLTQVLKPEFMFGYHTVSNTWQPFVIFKTNSFVQALQGMSEWEKTIPIDRQNFIEATSSLKDMVFRDFVIKNKNVRELIDSSGNSVLLYSFTNNETLVITTNEKTLREIFARLTPAEFGN